MFETVNILERQALTRQEAVEQQIHMAISLWIEKHFACAITLALAAEEQIPKPNSDKLYLTKVLADAHKLTMDKKLDFNQVRNWLKHCVGKEKIYIRDFDAIVALLRACTKYYASYGEPTSDMKQFMAWVKASGIYGAKISSQL